MPTQVVADLVTQRPLGLVFDIDGTLSPIAPTPADAYLYPGVRSLLEQARDHAGVHVAIVTGRAIELGAQLVNVEGITYFGSHGVERSEGLPTRETIQIAPEALIYVERSEQLLDLAEEKLASVPGILIERKRIGGAIHYRLSPDPEEARKSILDALTEPTRACNMRLSESKFMVELKTPLAINKGQALRSIVQHYALHGVLFAGDDFTDLNAVREVPLLRQEGITAYSIAVKHKDSPSILSEQADMTVKEASGMAEFLHDIVANL